MTPHQPVCSKFEATITDILSTWNMFKTFSHGSFWKSSKFVRGGLTHLSSREISTSYRVQIVHESQRFFFCCNPKWLQTHPKMYYSVKTNESHYPWLAFRASSTLDCILIIILGSNCIRYILKFGWFEASIFKVLQNDSSYLFQAFQAAPHPAYFVVSNLQIVQILQVQN